MPLAAAADRTERSRGRVWGWQPGTPSKTPNGNLRRNQTLGLSMRGLRPYVPVIGQCSVNIVCEVIEGAEPHQPPG